jgi:trk system potassium uptake protein TrkA
MGTKKRIIIAGCGRFGAMLANALHTRGHSVTVIDINPRAFDRLDTAFSGFTLIADATRVPILKSSGIPIADIFVACTQIDSNNVLMGEVAKRVFDVENVYVRLDDDDLTDLVRPYGITALCPHQLCLNEFELRSGIELGDDGQ